MIDLRDFLYARIAEDELIARSAQRSAQPEWITVERDRGLTGRVWDVLGSSGRFSPSFDAVEHVVRFQPARVLAECEAKGRIVSRCDLVLKGRLQGMFSEGRARDAHDYLRALGVVYVGHQDYREEWRPEDSGSPAAHDGSNGE